MSRYKNLTRKKRKFLEELVSLDDEYNFVPSYLFFEITEILSEKRYKTTDAPWLNKHLNECKEDYFKYKKIKENNK